MTEEDNDSYAQSTTSCSKSRDSMPNRSSFTLTQPFISGPTEKVNRGIPVTVIKETALKPEDLVIFNHTLPIGVSIGFSNSQRNRGKVLAAAFVDERNGLLIEFDGKKGDDWRDNPAVSCATTRQLLEDTVLCRPAGPLVGFDMGPLVLSLYADFGFLASNAIDIQSVFSPDDRQELASIKSALGEDTPGIKESRIEGIFKTQFYEHEDRRTKIELASRAWIGQHIVAECMDPELIDTVPAIDLHKLDPAKRAIIMKLAIDALRLEQLKPLVTNHQFTDVSRKEDDKVVANSAVYKHKFRGEKSVMVAAQSQRGTYYAQGTIVAGDGRAGVVTTAHNTVIDTTSITAIISEGREGMTLADQKRAADILRILQGRIDPSATSPFFANIWTVPEGGKLAWPAEWAKEKPTASCNGSLRNSSPSVNYKLPPLNASQQTAINHMLSAQGRLVIVQGPPGTGKTSVIGTYVTMAVARPDFKGLWLVAQSNVAVKNIAEKLMSIGFDGWKLLVAAGFHDGWHEHLYHDPRFRGHLINSKRFFMLSNNKIPLFTKHIPLHTLIIDEASQIEIGNYVSVFMNFASLRKVCFIGDPEQLPPHGEEDLQDLRSIFEVNHLKSRIIFLNTQYRMPPQIGEIVSSCIYNKQLKSWENHPIKDASTACYFVDVTDGREEKNDSSWKNTAEQDIVIKLAQNLQEAGMKYRIITPYEGQTSMIERRMREIDGLSWEDKCFNVDAFQGNEEDFIIISTVRTRSLGFLTNTRRTNVMLTRCKRGMYIITNRKFLEGPGGDCLVGEMLDALEEKFGEQIWMTVDEIQAGQVSHL
ncbi:hypothetical protein CC1G_06291 [Coprinopsis cinerea okayama7|uniref:DNA2/NAM7 helicase-like C-terminal domain-containing protein n=1 Tax=Coprinopsis cinerea (strain Okayama-7 / 130 / ATCC MYA-4618 / FGSC 9003) TaxID=240176 RepID=A8NTE0_COPC7|nr:hypothetical protein CC1G_06291 [Coprinopsis cinerea okayama7\|eukprot:XP_001836206.2 hypothetical protein CC1G_06291 [Coprinopsis cinerea okayama7\